MSHEGGPESTQQRTVAELLAMYGDNAGDRAPRRRRRRADDVSDTGAQAIIERVLSESGELAVVREDQPSPERTSHRHRSEPARPPAPPQPSGSHAAPPRQQQPPPAPRRQRPAPPPPEPRPPAPPLPAIAQAAEPTTPVRNHRQRRVPPAQPPTPSLRNLPPVGDRRPGPPPPTALLRSRPDLEPVEAVTEEMPRIGLPDQYAADRTPHVAPGERPVGLGSQPRHAPFPAPAPEAFAAVMAGDAPDRRYRDGYPGPDLDEDDLDDYEAELDEVDGLDDDLPDEDTRSASPIREWLVMAGQIALGVLGGAAVFLGFNWLWRELPAAALVAALVVIAGLVLVVRKIRRAEDLQSTVFAVLVGLFVTVSPAALLLLSR